ncbi:MAG: hypothetical protein ACOY42_07480 [Pseudomonadota bacterium]
MDGSARATHAMKALRTAALAALVAITPASAEVIRIPVGTQAMEKRMLETPRRGATQAQVRHRFGEPLQVQAAVGDPPISSWDYENYRVYFEGDLVLHTVLKGSARPAPVQP